MALTKIERQQFLVAELNSRAHWDLTGIPPQQELDLGSHKLHTLVKIVRDEFFPEIRTLPTVTFTKMNSLACVTTDSYPAHIHISSLFNRLDTPLEILTHIIKHEFIHLIIHPREVDGERKSHPPEFWALEHQISPQHRTCWNWIGYNFGEWIKRDQKKEKTRVLKKAYKQKVSELCTFNEADKLMPFPLDCLWGR